MSLPSVKTLAELRGWESLDLDHPARKLSEKKADADRTEQARLVAEVFGTEPGQRLLEQLIQAKIMRPAPLGRPEYERGLHDGEANLVRAIMAAIDIAKTAKKKI